MKKVIRLTESDLIRLVKKVIKEQNVLDDKTFAITKFVNLLNSKGWSYDPYHMASNSAFRPTKNDLSLEGYESKPLIFKKNSKYCYIERNGNSIACGNSSGSSELKKFKIPDGMKDFKQYIDSVN